MTSLFSVNIERELRAPVSKVFDAWTRADVITRWWKNLEHAEIDFRVGGEFLFRWKTWDGEVRGTYVEIVPNERVVFTWRPHPPPDGHAEETQVTLSFEARGSHTRIRLVHALNITRGEADSHESGWTRCLDDLQQDNAPRASHDDARQPISQ